MSKASDPKVFDKTLSDGMPLVDGAGQANRKNRLPPKFGVHHGVPFWDYLLWDAFGSGQVRKVGHSPAHLREDWTSGTDMNQAMLQGRAIHACVLEPDTEWNRYCRMDDGTDRRSKHYKELVIEYGKEFVLRDVEYDACIGGRDRLFAHSRIGKLLSSGSPEVTFAWEDDETGIPLKGRADWLNEDKKTVFDLKTTGEAREFRFKRVANDHGYPTQGAHYIGGLRAHSVDVEHYVIVALEVDPPYEPIIYRISTKDMMIAEAHHRALVDLLAWCIENDRWPGYPEHTHVLHMGQWWEAEVQEQIAVIQEAMT